MLQTLPVTAIQNPESRGKLNSLSFINSLSFRGRSLQTFLAEAALFFAPGLKKKGAGCCRALASPKQ